jgi:hypothetical protein
MKPKSLWQKAGYKATLMQSNKNSPASRCGEMPCRRSWPYPWGPAAPFPATGWMLQGVSDHALYPAVAIRKMT